MSRPNGDSGLFLPTANMFCVPSALEIITGEDPLSVIFPALNRAGARDTLTGVVTGEYMANARRALEEMGHVVRAYKGKAPLSSLVSTWAKRFPDHTLLISCGDKGERHCIVLRNGKVYDSWEPVGVPADFHPFANTKVRYAALVKKVAP